MSRKNLTPEQRAKITVWLYQVASTSNTDYCQIGYLKLTMVIKERFEVQVQPLTIRRLAEAMDLAKFFAEPTVSNIDIAETTSLALSTANQLRQTINDLEGRLHKLENQMHSLSSEVTRVASTYPDKKPARVIKT